MFENSSENRIDYFTFLAPHWKLISMQIAFLTYASKIENTKYIISAFVSSNHKFNKNYFVIQPFYTLFAQNKVITIMHVGLVVCIGKDNAVAFSMRCLKNLDYFFRALKLHLIANAQRMIFFKYLSNTILELLS